MFGRSGIARSRCAIANAAPRSQAGSLSTNGPNLSNPGESAVITEGPCRVAVLAGLFHIGEYSAEDFAGWALGNFVGEFDFTDFLETGDAFGDERHYVFGGES